jgi:DNA-binding transcriptional ArsR family regulator
MSPNNSGTSEHKDNRGESWLSKLGEAIPILLAYSLVVGSIAWGILEYYAITNIVSYSLPLSATDFAQISGAFGTVILTFGLLLLYHRQTQIQSRQAEIQENQESLMEQRYMPYLTGEVTPLNITTTQFQIRNTGDGPAYRVKAEWVVGDNEREWEIPSLSAGDEFGFPVIVGEDGNWLLGTDEIQEYLNERDASSIINYKITCENRFGEEMEFSGSVDFEVIINRSESSEIWENEPLEEISNELGKIRRDFKKVKGYKRNEDRASNWQHRVQQTSIIHRLVEENDELTIGQLDSLTNIGEGNIEYRLRTLDDAGIVRYDEGRKIVRPASESSDTTLDDF